MCNIINSSFVLIHTLKSKNSCTVSELVKRKSEIEEKFPSVFVDVSKKSIWSSIGCFPEIFEIKNDKIEKRINATSYFEDPVISYFDVNLETRLKMEVTKLLEADV